MKSGDAPQAPNPEVSIPLQAQENRKTFDYQLGQMRTNTAGPTGSVTWSKVPTFDEAGYNKALADWQAQNTQPIWVPAGNNPADSSGGGQVWDPFFGEAGGYVPSQPGQGAGYWKPGTTSGTAQPSRDAFTTYDWTQTTTLSPEQQALYDTNVGTQQNLSKQVQSALANPIDLSGAPALQTSIGVNPLDTSRSSGLAQASDLYSRGLADRSLGDVFNTNLADAAYRQQTRYLDPQVEQQRRQLEASLADQGFVPGTPGYEQAMRNFMDTNNRAYGAARDSAISQGYQQGNTQLGLQNAIAQMLAGQQGQAFGQELGANQQNYSQRAGAANFANQAREQYIQNLLLPRQQAINELAAVKGGQQIGMPQATGSSPTPNLGATDTMQALNQQYQGQLGAYNAQVGSSNATTGALASALAAFLFSDENLKEDIVDVGAFPSGIRIVKFRYKGLPQTHIGVLAQDVQKYIPEAVAVHESGFLMVDYGRLR